MTLLQSGVETPENDSPQRDRAAVTHALLWRAAAILGAATAGILVLVVALVWPRARRAFVRLLIRNDVIARRAYWTFVGGFIVFGVGRIAVALVSPETVAHL